MEPTNDKNNQTLNTVEGLKDLERISENFTNYPKIVEKWVDDSIPRGRPKRTTTTHADYFDSKALTRPARLGVGAKPAVNQKSHMSESVFSNYRLKMQLSGQERLPHSKQHSSTKDDLKMIIRSSSSLSQTSRNTKPNSISHGGDDDDDGSRAKSIGKKQMFDTMMNIPKPKKKRHL